LIAGTAAALVVRKSDRIIDWPARMTVIAVVCAETAITVAPVKAVSTAKWNFVIDASIRMARPVYFLDDERTYRNWFRIETTCLPGSYRRAARVSLVER
jgi:hypothetical protein